MFKKSLKKRLILAITLTLVVTQTLTGFWLWHEAQEQVAILSRTDLSAAEMAAQLHIEWVESVLAFLLPGIACVALASGLIYVALNRFLQPLERLVQELDQRTVQDLALLTTDETASTEIHSMITSVNSLLTRIALGVKQERAFAMDISHELRTPLAGIRIHLELLQEWQPQRIAPLIQRVDDMIETSTALLELARASQQNAIGQLLLTQVDLVQDVCLPLQSYYAETDFVSLHWHLPTEAFIRASATLLQAALRNLLENARKHAKGALVEVWLVQEQEQWVLTVQDNGPGVSADTIEQLTTVFFRADQTVQGYGLGLSIVKRIAQLHQAQFSLNNALQSGLKAQLRFI